LYNCEELLLSGFERPFTQHPDHRPNFVRMVRTGNRAHSGVPIPATHAADFLRQGLRMCTPCGAITANQFNRRSLRKAREGSSTRQHFWQE